MLVYIIIRGKTFSSSITRLGAKMGTFVKSHGINRSILSASCLCPYCTNISKVIKSTLDSFHGSGSQMSMWTPLTTQAAFDAPTISRIVDPSGQRIHPASFCSGWRHRVAWLLAITPFDSQNQSLFLKSQTARPLKRRPSRSSPSSFGLDPYSGQTHWKWAKMGSFVKSDSMGRSILSASCLSPPRTGPDGNAEENGETRTTPIVSFPRVPISRIPVFQNVAF